MIIDVLPNQYEALASKHSFRPWQTGLLGNMLNPDSSEQCISVNMGSRAGHTYFCRIIASSDFPSRTKVYVTRQSAFAEFAALLFSEDKVHEPIELIDSITTYKGDDVDFVLIDMSGESIRRFQTELIALKTSISPSTRMILLEPDFSIF